jgi:hypothetical protein
MADKGEGSAASVGEFAARWMPASGGRFSQRGRPLLGQRVTDPVVAQVACDTDDIRLIGVGSAGPGALHAAAFEPRIKRLTLEGALVSWSAVVRTRSAATS